MITELTFYAAAVPAVILLGLSKGGFSGIGSLALPLMALAISPVQAAAIMLPILLVQDAVSVFAYRRDWNGGVIKLLLPGACLGIALGYGLAAYVPEAAVLLVVGMISIVFGLRQLLRRAASPAAATPSRGAGWFWGGVSGFTSMIAHAGSPPYQVYVLPMRLPPIAFAATTSIFFAALNFIKIAPYVWLGQFTPENLLTAAILCPLAAVATWGGVVLVRRVSAARFYTAIYVILCGVGLKLIWDGIAGVSM